MRSEKPELFDSNPEVVDVVEDGCRARTAPIVGAEEAVPGSQQLLKMSQARRLLAECQTVDEVLGIRDMAEAMRVCQRLSNQGLAAQNAAAEIKLRAERKAGELLAAMPKHNGDPRSHDVTRLKDMGIEKMESHRYQKIASVGEEVFEKHVAETMLAGAELTTQGVLRLAKSAAKQRRNQDDESKVIQQEDADVSPRSGGSLAALVTAGHKFGTIYADPRWRCGARATSAKGNAASVSVEELMAMPVAEVAAENAHLHLWTPNAMLADAIAVMRAWGFRYASVLVWLKDPEGKSEYWRDATELVVLGVRGNCAFADRTLKSWIEAPSGTDASKPEEIRGLIERVSPGPRLDLFASAAVEGWTVLGNAVRKSPTRKGVTHES